MKLPEIDKLPEIKIARRPSNKPPDRLPPIKELSEDKIPKSDRKK